MLNMARISLIPLEDIDDPIVRESIERARRLGTPRPEIQRVMAHVPEMMKQFDELWRISFKEETFLEHELKELLRVRVATQLECEY
jgi:hypothetical protein